MRFVFILLILAFLIQSASANDTGSVSGQVTDDETGLPIVHANVIIEGTTLDALTQKDGSYIITGVPTGEYTVRAMMFGYTTEKKYRITVASGSSVEVHFALEKIPSGS